MLPPSITCGLSQSLFFISSKKASLCRVLSPGDILFSIEMFWWHVFAGSQPPTVIVYQSSREIFGTSALGRRSGLGARAAWLWKGPPRQPLSSVCGVWGPPTGACGARRALARGRRSRPGGGSVDFLYIKKVPFFAGLLHFYMFPGHSGIFTSSIRIITGISNIAMHKAISFFMVVPPLVRDSSLFLGPDVFFYE